MTIVNIQKCILNYYTSVKVGSYSIETICPGSYSISKHFFWHKIAGFLFYRNTLYILYIYIYRYAVVLSSGPICHFFCLRTVPFMRAKTVRAFFSLAKPRFLQYFVSSSSFTVIMWVLQVMSGLLWAISQHRTLRTKSWKLLRDSWHPMLSLWLFFGFVLEVPVLKCP